MKYVEKKLGDYIEILPGYAFKTKDFVEKGVPIIKIKNINPPMVTLEDLTYVSKEVAEKQRKFLLAYDDVLIAMTGSHINQWDSVVGRVARVKYNDKTLLNQRVGKITIKENAEADINYIYYFLSQDTVKISLAANAGGAANQANISPAHIKEILFPCPKLDVQKKIASILKAYDDLIENNQKQIKLLEEATQRLYKEWFIDLRFTGYEDVNIVDGMPEGWKKVHLSEIAPILTGKKDANFGDCDGKYLFFTCAQEPIKAPSYSFDCAAVILAGNGDFNVKLYRGKFEAYQRTYVFSPYNSQTLYLLYYAVKKSMRQLVQGASGSTIKFLTKRMLEEIQVFVPNEDVLFQFNKKCELCQKKVEMLKKQVAFMQEARDRLLPKLMSGEIEV